MPNDRGIGYTLLIGSVAGILVYGWSLWYFPTLILQITAFVAMASILGILGWIGWTMATTPPPAPLETVPTVQSTSTQSETESEKVNQ